MSFLSATGAYGVDGIWHRLKAEAGRAMVDVKARQLHKVVRLVGHPEV
eukprot:CAMPEP_0115178072 /NCGR_PEP_ID=MMETSP0270-20121206/5711_1 /TAXON_ID=71861 /ORGANISM="Scrippsiella trochoidea, Strain CCMP3099" /LENGTH=47 /DNA_ID= /DNA_START= /DNA_END= /DNA_ORIENTATION=